MYFISNIENIKIFNMININELYDNIANQYKIFLDKMDINILFDILYSLNYIYSYIGLLKLVQSYDNKIVIISDIDDVNKQIESLFNDIFTNKNILNFLIEEETTLNVIEEAVFVKRLIKKITEHKENIKKIIKQIESNLSKPNKINIMTDFKEIKKEIPQLSDIDTIDLTRTTYLLLLKKIKNPYIRKQLEIEYYKKAKICLSDFYLLIKERYNFVINKTPKCSSYLQYKRQKTYEKIGEINTVIQNLNNTLNERFEIEVNRIHKLLKKDGYDKKVDTVDIIYYKNKLDSKILFKTKNVITTIFNLINTIFKIDFIRIEKTDNTIQWNENVIIYKVINHEKSKNSMIGYLYIDFTTNITTTCICLSHRYVQKNSDKIYYPHIAIVSNFDKNIRYNDIIALMKEFGHAIRHLTLQTTLGSILYDNEFNNLVPNIMEYLFWDNIEKFNSSLSELDIEKIKFSRYIDFAYSIKLRCVYSLFDHIIHCYSDIILPEIKNENDIEIIYKKTYSTIMNTTNFNSDTYGISPTLLYQEINGNESILYENLLCEILSFSVYSEIREGKDFIYEVLKNNINPIGFLINKFLRNRKTNSYIEYLENVIKYNEISTEMIT